ncbi:hypothetical protein SVIO_041090 [Streptomyces violaceusniger]|uniref:Uncharacterized protein n=1 Tax=Streptomyces violaceusniger TaxID=68280 RepID=A0A4D4L2T8_STRVO|nr:hypothetical protein SVIO_041090 [Streptomyces violaceusniger]
MDRPQQDSKLLTYTPADAETQQRLERLHALALEEEAATEEAVPAAV